MAPPPAASTTAKQEGTSMQTALSLPKGGAKLDTLNNELEALSLTDFLRWSLDTFGEKIAHVTSFGPSGVVILDHLLRIKPDARVITLDTQFLFEDTYDLWQNIERRY